jgi:hypothetical protein
MNIVKENLRLEDYQTMKEVLQLSENNKDNYLEIETDEPNVILIENLNDILGVNLTLQELFSMFQLTPEDMDNTEILIKNGSDIQYVTNYELFGTGFSLLPSKIQRLLIKQRVFTFYREYDTSKGEKRFYFVLDNLDLYISYNITFVYNDSLNHECIDEDIRMSNGFFENQRKISSNFIKRLLDKSNLYSIYSLVCTNKIDIMKSFLNLYIRNNLKGYFVKDRVNVDTMTYSYNSYREYTFSVTAVNNKKKSGFDMRNGSFTLEDTQDFYSIDSNKLNEIDMAKFDYQPLYEHLGKLAFESHILDK